MTATITIPKEFAKHTHLIAISDEMYGEFLCVRKEKRFSGSTRKKTKKEVK